MQQTVTVTLPHHQYPVFIGPGVLARFGEILTNYTTRTRVTIVADAVVHAHYHELLTEACLTRGITAHFIPFDGKEEKKNLATVEALYDALFALKLDRGDLLVAFGGGVVGDIVGFVAATFLRGVRFIQVPTTLLSMVDASVGGKVGYNTTHGKNLIGAFYQPQAVVIDPKVLHSLPYREFVSGLAECIKHAVISGDTLVDWTQKAAPEIISLKDEVISELIFKNVSVKARIVEADEKEQGLRAHLNFGHTFAHAIENACGYGTWLHGEAVSLGICAATFAASEYGLCSPSLLALVEELLSTVGLPTRAKLPDTVTLLEAMQTDKKVQSGKLRIVAPKSLGELIITDEIPVDVIERAWEYIHFRS